MRGYLTEEAEILQNCRRIIGASLGTKFIRACKDFPIKFSRFLKNIAILTTCAYSNSLKSCVSIEENVPLVFCILILLFTETPSIANLREDAT